MKFVLFICIAVVVEIFIKIYMHVTFGNKLKKAANFSDKGENIEAIDIYSNIIDSHGKVKRAKGYVYRGNCYLKMGRYIDALHDLSDSIRVVQIPDINMVLMGDFFCAVKKYSIAFKYFSKAVKFKPKSSMTHLSLGLFYYRTKQYDKAIESFDRALEYRHNKSICYWQVLLEKFRQTILLNLSQYIFPI
ncbi:tetratricopeptide repeat protein [Clostridium sp. CF011]|uniref:tetratricopeptide repeat protein n=1 Tax=Clostridium sp. CF011 TaxID=2843318 RepID=UPI001C0E4625|nr:tetratricopeptide repeat protein [Clostridium sp. CF011]MBU3093675.1 tetratricopeptide repeat protein [Clostridium sp. CF011]WAG70668.1 tetratricopeptide repeat protein [Clostridium sp. CF011]